MENKEKKQEEKFERNPEQVKSVLDTIIGRTTFTKEGKKIRKKNIITTAVCLDMDNYQYFYDLAVKLKVKRKKEKKSHLNFSSFARLGLEFLQKVFERYPELLELDTEDEILKKLEEMLLTKDEILKKLEEMILKKTEKKG